jgi:hypothetical protein
LQRGTLNIGTMHFNTPQSRITKCMRLITKQQNKTNTMQILLHCASSHDTQFRTPLLSAAQGPLVPSRCSECCTPWPN